MSSDLEQKDWEELFSGLNDDLSSPLSSASGSLCEDEPPPELLPLDLPHVDLSARKLIPLIPPVVGALRGKTGAFSGTLGSFSTLSVTRVLKRSAPEPTPAPVPAPEPVSNQRVKLSLAVVRSLRLKSSCVLDHPLLREVDLSVFDKTTFKGAEAALRIDQGPAAVRYCPDQWRIFAHYVNQNPQVLQLVEEPTLWLLVSLRDVDIRNLFGCRVGKDSYHMRFLFLQELSRRVGFMKRARLRTDPTDSVK